MRIRITLDDVLLAEARGYSGIDDVSAVVNAGLKALVEREAARRLASLGGSGPTFKAAPRRRSEPTDGNVFELKLLDPRLPNWGFPHWGSALSAGLDLHACLDETLRLAPGAAPVLVSAGFALRIGEAGWCGLVAPRSGSGHRGLVLGNTVGIIDADYEGPVMLSCWNRNTGPDAAEIVVEPGERIAQMLFVPVARPAFQVVDVFSSGSERGEGGFGSTGRGTP